MAPTCDWPQFRRPRPPGVSLRHRPPLLPQHSLLEMRGPPPPCTSMEPLAPGRQHMQKPLAWVRLAKTKDSQAPSPNPPTYASGPRPKFRISEVEGGAGPAGGTSWHRSRHQDPEGRIRVGVGTLRTQCGPQGGWFPLISGVSSPERVRGFPKVHSTSHRPLPKLGGMTYPWTSTPSKWRA